MTQTGKAERAARHKELRDQAQALEAMAKRAARREQLIDRAHALGPPEVEERWGAWGGRYVRGVRVRPINTSRWKVFLFDGRHVGFTYTVEDAARGIIKRAESHGPPFTRERVARAALVYGQLTDDPWSGTRAFHAWLLAHGLRPVARTRRDELAVEREGKRLIFDEAWPVVSQQIEQMNRAARPPADPRAQRLSEAPSRVDPY